ncbi:hypothetical protein JHK82_030717 [Glycine max]|nr:hypothetical protein JHK85_031357 [Glycine max]KAG5123980.1 hypothetical protein JHK82_030717 [Glycine max]KAG5145395.1 hypothetical protein JHK84_030938 [Glycine max]
MTFTPFSPKSHHQSRSKSLPCRQHPLILQCNQHLGSLEASPSDNSTSSSSSLFRHKLTGLQTLHDCIEKLVRLPLTQEVLVQERQEKWVDELLDGSLRLLDVCTVAKDSLLHMKECARELQSIMRRKRGGEMEVAAEVRKFLASRKVIKKAILKALENLQATVKKAKFPPSNKDNPTVTLASLFKDVQVITLSILESLLNFISGPAQSKPSKWSLVSKLMHNKKVTTTTQESDPNEFSNVDAALQSFVFHMTRKADSISHLQNQLEDLESVIQGFVEGLETLFKPNHRSGIETLYALPSTHLFPKKKKWQPLKRKHKALYIFAATACPLVSQLEEQLQRLRCSEATSSLSSSSVCHKLNDTLDLHDYTDKLLQLPIEQQVLAQECNDKCVDDLLEGSLRLLDIC